MSEAKDNKNSMTGSSPVNSDSWRDVVSVGALRNNSVLEEAGGADQRSNENGHNTRGSTKVGTYVQIATRLHLANNGSSWDQECLIDRGRASDGHRRPIA